MVQLSRRYADVCVVNDASTDATPQIIAGMEGIHTIHHTRTRTYLADSDGMRYAFEAGYDFAYIDAGLSHDPHSLQDFKNIRKPTW